MTIVIRDKHTAWFEGREWHGISRTRDVACTDGLRARLKSGYRLYRAGGDCACGWFRETEAADPERDAKLWKKFANKGWSVEKTRRAYEQALAGAEPNGEPGGFRDPLPEHVATIVRTRAASSRSGWGARRIRWSFRVRCGVRWRSLWGSGWGLGMGF